MSSGLEWGGECSWLSHIMYFEAEKWSVVETFPHFHMKLFFPVYFCFKKSFGRVFLKHQTLHANRHTHKTQVYSFSVLYELFLRVSFSFFTKALYKMNNICKKRAAIIGQKKNVHLYAPNEKKNGKWIKTKRKWEIGRWNKKESRTGKW